VPLAKRMHPPPSPFAAAAPPAADPRLALAHALAPAIDLVEPLALGWCVVFYPLSGRDFFPCPRGLPRSLCAPSPRPTTPSTAPRFYAPASLDA
jgi:hypothetical protein